MKRGLIIAAILVIPVILITVFPQTGSAAGQWEVEEVGTGVLDPAAYYFFELKGINKIWHIDDDLSSGNFYISLHDLLIAEVSGITSQTLSGLSASEIRDIAHINDVTYYVTEIEGLTDQIWAVQVEAKAGKSGSLSQDFEAAYGPYGGLIADPDGSVPSGEEDKWFFQPDRDGYWQTTVGEDYVGNYFHIDQAAHTSDGTIRSYISISSPWSHAFLEENMSIEGEVTIKDSFAMDNIAPGAEIAADWWSMF